MKVQLLSVELWESLRGPGPRNLSDSTATFTTMKVRPGEKEPQPTGLSITWDTDAQAVYLALEKSQVEPLVIVPWRNVKRAIPVDGASMLPHKKN